MEAFTRSLRSNVLKIIWSTSTARSSNGFCPARLSSRVGEGVFLSECHSTATRKSCALTKFQCTHAAAELVVVGAGAKTARRRAPRQRYDLDARAATAGATRLLTAAILVDGLGCRSSEQWWRRRTRQRWSLRESRSQHYLLSFGLHSFIHSTSSFL